MDIYLLDVEYCGYHYGHSNDKHLRVTSTAPNKIKMHYSYVIQKRITFEESLCFKNFLFE